MNQILAGILFTFAFVVALIVGLRDREEERIAPAAFRAKVQETILKARAAPTPIEKKAPVPGSTERGPASVPSPPAPSENAKFEPLNRESFQRTFGEKMEWTLHEGRVIRIDGTAISLEAFDSSQRISRFRPSNHVELTARGREIFESARRLVGAPSNAEFLNPAVNGGESSGQVSFQQAVDGVPVYPGGLVTVLVGSEGELRTLDSSVYPVIRVTNAPAIAMGSGARHILYVTQSEPTALVKHAYETRDHGIQTVIDAQTGAVLLERNRQIR
jgi:hypothetical protein